MPTDTTDLRQRIAEACGGVFFNDENLTEVLRIGATLSEDGYPIFGDYTDYDLTTLDGLFALFDDRCKGWTWGRVAGEYWCAFKVGDMGNVRAEVPDTGDVRADFTRLLCEVLEAMKGKGCGGE